MGNPNNLFLLSHYLSHWLLHLDHEQLKIEKYHQLRVLNLLLVISKSLMYFSKTIGPNIEP